MPPSDSDQALESLEAEFPHLDSVLVAAIYYDTNSIPAARQTLQLLSDNTSLDESICDDTLSCITEPTTVTSSSPDEDDNDPPNLRGLRSMFPQISRFKLLKTLEKYGDDYERATDELLNAQFLEEDGAAAKGVDAFEFGGEGSRKKKGKRKVTLELRPENDRRMSLPITQEDDGRSVWDRKKEEIDFLSSTLGVPRGAVSSAHHSSGGDMGKTLSSVLKTYGDQVFIGDKEEFEAELSELKQEFLHEVSEKELSSLLRLCRENKAAVFHLAELLRRSHASSNIITPTPTPLSTRPQPPQPKDTDWTVVPPPRRTSITSPTSPRDAHNTLALASTYAHARNSAFQQAAAAYRRSRSDKLFGGAAAFYADLGKDFHSKHKELSDLAAEQFVAANSDSHKLDLHGVTVPQALKIAKEAVTRWWVETPVTEDVAKGMVKPFVIVTGVGRHSKGGEAKLGPAVGRMLVRERWRIEVCGGEIVVFGPSSRK